MAFREGRIPAFPARFLRCMIRFPLPAFLIIAFLAPAGNLYASSSTTSLDSEDSTKLLTPAQFAELMVREAVAKGTQESTGFWWIRGIKSGGLSYDIALMYDGHGERVFFFWLEKSLPTGTTVRYADSDADGTVDYVTSDSSFTIWDFAMIYIGVAQPPVGETLGDSRRHQNECQRDYSLVYWGLHGQPE